MSINLKLWDFVCKNCKYQEEFLLNDQDKDICQPCPICQGDMVRSIVRVNFAFFDKEKYHAYLKRRSKEHTAQAVREGGIINTNESGISSDPVWRNKTRPKNCSSYTLSQHKYDHLKK